MWNRDSKCRCTTISVGDQGQVTDNHKPICKLCHTACGNISNLSKQLEERHPDLQIDFNLILTLYCHNRPFATEGTFKCFRVKPTFDHALTTETTLKESLSGTFFKVKNRYLLQGKYSDQPWKKCYVGLDPDWFKLERTATKCSIYFFHFSILVEWQSSPK